MSSNGDPRELAGWLAGLVGQRDPQALLGALLHLTGSARGLLLWRAPAGVQVAACHGLSGVRLERACERLTATYFGRVADGAGHLWTTADGRVCGLPLLVDGHLVGAVYVEGDGPVRPEWPPPAGRRAVGVASAGAHEHDGEIVAVGPAMRAVLEALGVAARFPFPLLLVGESGTGKELAARHVHRRGPRACGPFVAANCGAIPEPLQESELFGHTRGAFTGALSSRRGLFEQADGGTLFLDEVEAMRPSMQEALLRALERGEVRPVGSEQILRVDVRVIAATNQPLEAMVREGKFRADLYWRLAVLKVRLPPLRERKEDIPALAGAILRRLADGGPPFMLDPSALTQLQAHSWPGHVRELENALKRAVAHARGPRLTAADFDFLSAEPDLQGGEILPVRRYIVEVCRRHSCGLSRAEIARRLGVSRKFLWKLMREAEQAPPSRTTA